MGTDITPQRRNVVEQEVDFKSGIAERTWFKIGGAINFVNTKQFDTHTFFLNGEYFKAGGLTGLEGLYVLQNDIEIVGVSVGNLVAGSTGTTTLDVHLIDGGGTDQGSIFSTKPSITTAAGNNAYAAENYLDALSQVTAGITLPVIPVKDFDRFDAFRFDVDSAMSVAENCFFSIHFRPR